MAEKSKGDKPSLMNRLFDLRVVIAVLFGFYGIVCFGMGLAGPDKAELAKSGGINVNLWAGLGMLVAAALFVVWTWVRPLRAPAAAPAAAEE